MEKRQKGGGGLVNQYEEEEEKGKTEMIKWSDKESDSRRTWEERQGARKNNREIGHEWTSEEKEKELDGIEMRG